MPDPTSRFEQRNYVEVELPRTGVIVQSLTTMLGWTGGGSGMLFVVALMVALARDETLLPDTWGWLDHQWLGLAMGWGLGGAIFAACVVPCLGIWLNFLTAAALDSYRGDGVPLHTQRERARTRYVGLQGAGIVTAIIGGLMFGVLLITAIVLAADDEAPPALWFVVAAMLGIGLIGRAIYRRTQPLAAAEAALEDRYLPATQAAVMARVTRERIDDQVARRLDGPAPYQQAEHRWSQFSRRSAQVLAVTLVVFFLTFGVQVLARARCGCSQRSFDEPVESAVRTVGAINSMLFAVVLVFLLITGAGFAILSRPFHQAMRTAARSTNADQQRPDDRLLQRLVTGPTSPPAVVMMAMIGSFGLGVGLTSVLLPSPVQHWGGLLLAVGSALIIGAGALQIGWHQRAFADRTRYRAVWPVVDPLPRAKPGKKPQH